MLLWIGTPSDLYDIASRYWTVPFATDENIKQLILDISPMNRKKLRAKAERFVALNAPSCIQCRIAPFITRECFCKGVVLDECKSECVELCRNILLCYSFTL
jgi:hypothetical protein